MAMVYAALIINDKKTFSQVPDRLRDAVKEILVNLELGDLVKSIE